MKKMKMSVSGDIGAQRGAAGHAALKRRIKAVGRTGACAKPLKYRAFAKAGGDNS